MESTGPDVKVRGPASVIYERYLQLARDASSSGDRVMAENYLQHAEHYFRLVRQMQPAMPPPPQPSDRYGDMDFEAEDEGGEAEAGEDAQAAEDGGGDQPDVDFSGQQQSNQGQDGDRDGFRRRRGRRNRFRPGGDGDLESGPQAEGGGDRRERTSREPREGQAEGAERRERPPREPREAQAEGVERRERPPRERRDDREPAGEEGFSSGPKPAFLRGGD